MMSNQWGASNGLELGLGRPLEWTGKVWLGRNALVTAPPIRIAPLMQRTSMAPEISLSSFAACACFDSPTWHKKPPMICILSLTHQLCNEERKASLEILPSHPRFCSLKSTAEGRPGMKWPQVMLTDCCARFQPQLVTQLPDSMPESQIWSDI